MNDISAPTAPGEVTIVDNIPSTGNILPVEIGPLKYLLSGGKRLLYGLKEVLKNKKKLIAVIILSVLWLILTISQTIGITSPVFRFLSFLTFAGGGTTGGLLGFAGGIFGKGLFAYMLLTLVIPLLTKKKTVSGIGDTLRTFKGYMIVKDPVKLSPVAIGAGCSFILFNIMTGNASFQNSMAGITGFVLTLRALTYRTGFLRGFITSILNKINKGKRIDITYINRIIAGLAGGFALSVPMSLISMRYIGYLIGLIVLIGGFIFKILVTEKENKKKGVHSNN